MSIHRSKKPLTKFYQLNGHILQKVSENPYLGLIIRDDLQWSSHIAKTCSKANSTLGFIRRNLRNVNSSFKQTAYISLVRSVLEYSCSVWDPHLEKDISRIEGIQRKAARFVKSDYSSYNSVTDMMTDLKWKPLQQRRREHRLTLLYKIINNLIAIPPEELIHYNPRTYRHKHSKQIIVKSPNVNCYKYSFLPRTIIDWNNLTEDDVNCQTIAQFKAVMQKQM